MVLATAQAGTRLSELPPRSVEDLARVAFDVASSLAALHERGIVHGAVSAAHVLVDDDAPARLCGFAEGGRIDAGFDPAVDVRGLGELLLEQLPRSSDRVDGELRQRLTALAHRAAQNALGLEEFLAIAPRVLPHRPAVHKSRPRVGWAGVAAALLITVGAVVAVAAPQRAGSPAVRVAPFTYADGIYTSDAGAWAIGTAGDVVALGDWDCDGTTTPALLRPRTGAAYAFNRWADDIDLVADALGVVDGATAVRAVDVDGDGCDDVVIDRIDDDPVILHPAVDP